MYRTSQSSIDPIVKPINWPSGPIDRADSHQVRRTCPSTSRCHQDPEGVLGQTGSTANRTPIPTMMYTKQLPCCIEMQPDAHTISLRENATRRSKHVHNGNMPYSRRSASFTGEFRDILEYRAKSIPTKVTTLDRENSQFTENCSKPCPDIDLTKLEQNVCF